MALLDKHVWGLWAIEILLERLVSVEKVLLSCRESYDDRCCP